MNSKDKDVFCKLCGRRITEEMGHYVVRIEVFAADEPPEKLIQFGPGGDFAQEVQRLLDEISNADPHELEDSVYKFFRFDLCRPCQREYLKNPLPYRD